MRLKIAPAKVRNFSNQLTENQITSNFADFDQVALL